MKLIQISYVLLVAVASLSIGCSDNQFTTTRADSRNLQLSENDRLPDDDELLEEGDKVPVDEPMDKEVRKELENKYRCHIADNDNDRDCDGEQNDDEIETTSSEQNSDGEKKQGKGDKKVQICHVPPGNPDARHTICIGAPAVRAHVLSNHNHGDAALQDRDHYGPCEGE